MDSEDGRIRTVPTATHWGTYLARTDGTRLLGLEPHPDDPAPTAIGDSVTDALRSAGRLTVPLIRRGWLENGPGPAGTACSRRRGDDSYVAVDWTTATKLVAGEIERVRTSYGNSSIFGGSYGWGSAGRFHHPQSQVHRFLNMTGGYTRSVDTYSSAAITVLLRRVGGGWQTAMDSSPTFDEIAEHGSLVVAFGGLALRNSQVNDGGLGAHTSPGAQQRARASGVDFFSVSPLRTDAAEFLNSTWLPARPGTDVAVMLGLAHTIVSAGLHDLDFLTHCTVGWAPFEDYLMGRSDGVPKDANWASGISGLAADTIEKLGHRIATERTVISTSYSVQRADHGEQAPWMALTLAAMSGSMGRPGGGFGCGLGALHRNGMRLAKVPVASFPQGVNSVADFIPVARISDLLTKPGETFDYDGGSYVYPDIRLVYWVGGNPFHHHQDLNRLVDAWQRPDTVIVHEHFANALARHADIVLPAATFAERNDFAAGREDPYLMAMLRAADPPGDVLTDYDIFAGIAEHLGLAEKFTEGRSADEWVRELYERTRKRAAALDVQLPDWSELVELGRVSLPDLDRPAKPYAALRADPARHPIATPSGLIEIFSDTIAGFGYPDCPPHPTWLEPSRVAGITGRATIPARAGVRPAGATPALAVRQRSPLAGREDRRPRTCADQSGRRADPWNYRRRRGSAVQRPRGLPGRRGALGRHPARRRPAVDRGLVRPADAGRARRAREPECADRRPRNVRTGPGTQRAHGSGRAGAVDRTGSRDHRLRPDAELSPMLG